MSPEDKELQRLKQRDHVSKHSMCVHRGVSEIRVLILTSGGTRQIMELFSITFLRKSNTN
jgi:hypothetical protein